MNSSSTQPLLSYAQNGEDVRLLRALGDRPRGTYVEIGANDPEEYSISRAFYERGWSGVVVEPIQSCVDKFRRTRPRDRIVQAVCSTRVGNIPFYEIEVEGQGNGLSTTDPKAAQDNVELGTDVREYDVQSLGMHQILEGVEHVDFMVIDVEGAEADVISSLINDVELRPEILVVEAIHPRIQTPSHEGWEPVLLENGYRTVTFDGINRFYVHDSADPDLAQLLAIPPNVTDSYVVAKDYAERLDADKRWNRMTLTSEFNSLEAAALRAENLELRIQANAQRKQAAKLRRRIHTITNSRSYRAVQKARRSKAKIRKLLK